MIIKTLVLLLLIVVLINPSCLSQQGSYKTRIDELVSESQVLGELCNDNALDFSSYDSWYQDFKNLAEQFKKDFFWAYKERQSFKTLTDGLNGLSFAWGIFKQMGYAQKEYEEAITLAETEDAHKWKRSAIDHKKNAYEIVRKALDSLKQAQELAKQEPE